MTRHEIHPTMRELDTLRAGLLDEHPDRKSALLTHVEECGRCRHAIDRWSTVIERVQEAHPEHGFVAQQLETRRRTALSGQARTPRSRTAPRFALATAAVLTVGLAVGLLFNLQSFAPAPFNGTEQASISGASDLYAELDFYEWLSQQSLSADTNGNET